jgi:5-formyltetrahydrofolate cyclo-ligase
MQQTQRDVATSNRQFREHGGKITVMSSAESSAPMSQRKAQLRHSLLGERPQSNAGLTEQLIELVKVTHSKHVGCYAAKSGEPDTLPFLKWSLSEGVAVYTPSIVENSIRWRRHLGELEPGRFGIGESTGLEIAVTDLELLLIPAIAASPSGQRLGRGGGYFDRELQVLRNSARESHPTVAAIVFDTELLYTLPTEAHDEPVDFVVTPSKTIRCKPEHPIEEI